MSGWCDRPGCAALATTTFTFDGSARVVRLDDVRSAAPSVAGRLCARHAERLSPPRGWHVERHVVADPVDAVDAAAGPDTRDVVDVTDAEPAGGAATWSPTGDPGDDLGEILDARTPLLSRAFRSARG